MPKRGRPYLFVKPPKMKHGDADRLADFMGRVGQSIVPWQREFLSRLESASMDEQFGEIIRASQGAPASDWNDDDDEDDDEEMCT